MTATTFRRLGTLLLLVMTALALIWRWRIAGGLEPRWDQAGYFLWLESALDSRHLLPQGPLEADDLSVLYNLLRPIALQPQLLLTATDWLISLPFLVLGGVNYGALLLGGLTASALSVGLLVLGLLQQSAFAEPRARLIAAGLAGAALLLNGYSVHYSGFVLHNYGAFFLLLCALTLEEGARSGGRHRLWAGLILLAALYSHWTVLLLLPPALGARLLFAAELPWRRRLVSLVQLGVILALALAPLAAVILALHGASPAGYMELGQYRSQPWLGPLLRRIGFWFAEGGELFSYPGLAAGIAGLVLLARRGRCIMPAWLLLTHFLLTAAMPGFTWNGSDTYLRTYLYAVPLLCLGIGALVLEISTLRPLAGGRAALAGATALLLLGHFAPPFGQAVGMRVLAERSPRYEADFMAGQGKIAAAAHMILPLLPDGSTVIPSGWGARDMFFAVTDRPTRRYRFPFTLETALNRADNGTLEDFFHRRGLAGALLADTLYVLSAEPRAVEEIAADLRKIGGSVAGSPAAFEVQSLAQWQVGAWGMESVSLYRVTPAP